MKGFVPTPSAVVDLMVEKLFAGHEPGLDAALLDPGCGEGEFIAGVIRHCSRRGWPLPRIVGVELDPGRATTARRRFKGIPQIEVRQADFLVTASERFDYIVGNPPYVSILGLDLQERQRYRARYRAASGRFDLYTLFFEQALNQLATGGRLVFISPEKFLYVETARPLRELLAQHQVEEFHFLDEATFDGLVTYPLVTTIREGRGAVPGPTRMLHRDGRTLTAVLRSSDSWLPTTEGFDAVRPAGMVTLADISMRVSCGVATGADAVFLISTGQIPDDLRSFAHRTVAGRQITANLGAAPDSCLLAPYDERGRLLREADLGPLGDYLREPDRKEQLAGRSCTARKPWYAYHDSFPVEEMLRPKLLCKDITAKPFFVTDPEGALVPRHSVYYVVPTDPGVLDELCRYLNSQLVADWLRAHCQRAANGFLRLQSHVLKQVPVPPEFVTSPRTATLDAQQELLIA